MMRMKTNILVGSLICLFQATAAKPDRPNFLVILTDDQGYGDVSIHEAQDIRTPHIDRLAAQGMRFTNVRANATVCSPSRAALLTGCYPDRVGVPGVIRAEPANSWGYLSPAVPTLPELLAAADYHTALIGKWHLGLEAPNTPNKRGFEFFHGFLGDMMDSYTRHLRHGVNYMRHNEEVIRPEGHATDLFSDWACDFLRGRGSSNDKPFFLYLAYNAPHFPIEPPAEWLRRVTERIPGMELKRAMNAAFVEHLDNGIGRVLAALKESGLEEDTVVVFSSDNGGALEYAQSNAPWRDGKQSHYDGGLRVPFIISWPGRIQPGTLCENPGLLFDVFPTILDLAGVVKPPGLDAVSLVPVLDGRRTDAPREMYFVRREGGGTYHGAIYEALIQGDWKLMRNTPFQPLELYNLQNDPQERNNLAENEPEVFARLARALSQHIQRGGATPWQAPEERSR